MITLPDEYFSYWDDDRPREGELAIEPLWFVLWPPEEVEQMNREYQVELYAPGFWGFGSSGGGEMLAFDKNHKIFTIPFVGMCPEDALPVADSWQEFVGYMK